MVCYLTTLHTTLPFSSLGKLICLYLPYLLQYKNDTIYFVAHQHASSSQQTISYGRYCLYFIFSDGPNKPIVKISSMKISSNLRFYGRVRKILFHLHCDGKQRDDVKEYLRIFILRNKMFFPKASIAALIGSSQSPPKNFL